MTADDVFEGRHAVVVGASTTGLIASGALSPHFDKVTILDRDALPDAPEWRKGVPQSRHVHLLLRRGEQVMNQFFPGLSEELVAGGGQRVDMSADARWFYAGGYKLRFPSGMTMASQSKGFLEWSLRNRALQLPNVTIRDHAEVDDLLVAGERVTGVRLRNGESLTADLVVDASGRNSRTPQRLEANGFGRVETSFLEVDVGYATRTYKAPANGRDWLTAIIHPTPPGTRVGIIIPIEGNRWMATIVGSRGDHPPADEDGYLAFARGMDAPDIYDAIKGAEPLGPVHLHRFTGNQRRHYDRLASMPDGLIVIGDACSSFNPIYGQGMAHGASAAPILDETLRRQRREAGAERLAGLSHRFQRAYAAVGDNCWLISTADDYREPRDGEPRPIWAGTANWYLDNFHELTWRDEKAAYRFLEVMHLLRPATAMFAPGLAARTVAHGLFARHH